MKKQRIVLLFAMFVLSSLPLLLPFHPLSASADMPVYTRYRSYETYSYPDGTSQYNSRPTALFKNGKYIEYAFNSSGNSYFAQAGLIGANISEKGATFYDPNLMAVVVQSEFWVVFRNSSGLLIPVMIQAPSTFKSSSYTNTSNYVEVTMNYGFLNNNLSIAYHFEEKLKHTVNFTANAAGDYVLAQAWLGVSHSNLTLTNSTKLSVSALSNKTIVRADAASFLFGNDTQPFGVFEDENSEPSYSYAIIGGFNNRLGAVYVFANKTLVSGQILTIDPTTYSQTTDGTQPAPFSGFVAYNGAAGESYASVHNAASGTNFYNTSMINVGQGYDSEGPARNIYRGLFQFTTPTYASISNIKLCLFGMTDYSGVDFTFRIQKWTGTGGPNSTAEYSKFDGINYDDNDYSTSSFTTTGYNNITISNSSLIVSNGATRIMLRSSRDVASTAPGATQEEVWVYDSTVNNASRTPYLTFTYSTNSNPTNDGCAATDLDSGSKALAYNAYYTFSVNVSDADGVTDINYVELRFEKTAGVYTNILRWTRSSGAFSVQAGNMVLSGSSNTTVGTQARLLFKVAFDWGFSTVASFGAQVYTIDASSATDTDNYALGITFVNALALSGGAPTTNTTWAAVSSKALISGSVIYNGTAVALPITHFNSVSVHDVAHSSQGTNTTATAFSMVITLPSTAASNVYHISIDVTDANYTDGDLAGSVTVASDSVTVTISGPTSPRISINSNSSGLSATAKYDLNGTTLVGTITWNDTTWIYASAIRKDFTVSSVSGTVTTIRSVNPNSTYEIWDSVTVTISGPTVARISINVNASGLSASGIYDYDGVAYNGTFSWNDTTFTMASATRKAFAVSSISGGSYPQVTAIRSLNPNSTAEIWDSVTIIVTGPTSQRINVGINMTALMVSGTYDYDSTPYAGTFTLNDTTFNHAAVGRYVFAVSSISGGSYPSVTAIRSTNPNSTFCIWDSLNVTNIQAVTYLGSGQYRYDAEIVYGYDNTSISNATVGVAYPNGTSIGSVVSNSSGWVTLVIGQGNASSGTFSIYGISEPSYNITMSGGNQTFTLRQWTLATVDIDGNILTNTNISISTSVIIWTGSGSIYVPPATYNTSVSWLQGLVLNTTLNVAVSADKTSSFNCTAYPYIISGTRFWAASNSTISTESFASNLLTLNFSTSGSTYILVCSSSTKPSYILNATYDYGTDFSTYLTLTHYGNRTLTISYETWGNTNIQMTDAPITSAGFVGQRLTIVLAGTNGTIGNLKVYCSSRGNAVETGGFTTTSYVVATTVLSGNYASSDSVSVYVDWTGGSGSTGPGGDLGSNVATTLTVDAVVTFPSLGHSGYEINASVTVTFSGFIQIYLNTVELSSPYNWSIQIPDGLPMPLWNGSATFNVTITVPSSQVLGVEALPFDFGFSTPSGAIKVVHTTALLDIASPAYVFTLPETVTLLLVGLLVGFGVVIPAFRKDPSSRSASISS